MVTELVEQNKKKYFEAHCKWWNLGLTCNSDISIVSFHTIVIGYDQLLPIFYMYINVYVYIYTYLLHKLSIYLSKMYIHINKFDLYYQIKLVVTIEIL